ncbi:hypothetical protein SNE40_017334 [Patella caerulea]|uniref:Uncharacterized protein n=1 Tax=Patella caerulea TaxID=87958 RepID=A0AAN8PDW5_PATCE
MKNNWWSCLLLFILPIHSQGLEFLIEPQDGVTMLSQSFWWHCQAKPDANPVTYSWRVGDADAPTSDNQVVFPNGTLLIKDVKPSSIGVYMCVVTTGSGTISSQTLNLRLAALDPRFTVNPSDTPVIVKTQAILECAINSYPSPIITWLLGDVPVTRGTINMISRTQSILTIPAVSYSDEGNYSCLATNSMLNQNVTSSTALLTVQGRPELITPPDPQESPVGLSAIFNCIAAGKPPPSLTWFFTPINGARVEAKTISEFVLHENGSLSISSVADNLAGFYTCEASNSLGVDMKTVRLTVTGPPLAPVINATSPDQQAVEGTTVKFQCQASGNPQPTITWSKVDGDLPASRVTYPAPDELMISNIQTNDRGSYVCEAVNIQGRVTSSSKLDILAAPAFIERPVSVTVPEGSSIALKCRASGNPKPKVSWKTPLAENLVVSVVTSGMVLGVDGTLTISYTESRHHGIYTCTISNTVGFQAVTATVNVQGPPTFINQPASLLAVAGDAEIIFTCRVAGFPQPVISWYRDGVSEPITSNGKYELMSEGDLKILNIEATDAGLYYCWAENEYSKDYRIANLRVLVPPRFTVRPADQQVRLGQTVTLNCITEGDPVPVQKWLKDGQTVVIDTNMKLYLNSTIVINDIKQHQIGQYVCQSTNQGGSAIATANIFTTDIPVLRDQPVNVTVGQGQDVIIRCNMTADATPTITWYKSDDKATRISAIDKNTGFRIHSTVGGDLLIKNSQLTDETWYVCVGVNQHGETTSDTVYVDVQVPPTILRTNSPQISANQNTTTLSCDATGDPNPLVSWRSPRGVSITKTTTGYVMTTNSLTITTVSTATDGGDWTCVACNDVSCAEATVQLLVEGPPYITGVSTFRNSTYISLECLTTGIPKPNVTYLIGSQGVTGTVTGHVISGNRLTVSVPQIQDTYRCLVQNPFGSDTRVMKKPGTPTKPLPVQFDSRSITLTWSDGDATGLPVDKYLLEYQIGDNATWVDGNVTSTESPERHKSIGLKPFSSYLFRVRISNVLDTGGYSVASDRIRTLADAPSVPLNIEVKTLHRKITVKFDQAEEFNGDPANIRYQIDLKIKPPGQSFFIVLKSFIVLTNQTLYVEFDDLNNGEYIVEMKSKNMAVSKESQTIKIPTMMKDQPPIYVPVITSLISLGPDQITITWTLADCKPCSPPITGYLITIQKVGGSNQTEYEVDDKQGNLTIDGLEEFTNYSLTVAAVNTGGTGPKSLPKSTTTQYSLFSELVYTGSLLTTGETVAIIGGIVGFILLILILIFISVQCRQIYQDRSLRYRRHSPRLHRFYLGHPNLIPMDRDSEKSELSSSWKPTFFRPSKGKYKIQQGLYFTGSRKTGNHRNVEFIGSTSRRSLPPLEEEDFTLYKENPAFQDPVFNSNDLNKQTTTPPSQNPPPKPKRQNRIKGQQQPLFSPLQIPDTSVTSLDRGKQNPDELVYPPRDRTKGRNRSNSVRQLIPESPVDQKPVSLFPIPESLSDTKSHSSYPYSISHTDGKSGYSNSHVDNTLPELETLSRLFADIEAEEEKLNQSYSGNTNDEFYY